MHTGTASTTSPSKVAKISTRSRPLAHYMHTGTAAAAVTNLLLVQFGWLASVTQQTKAGSSTAASEKLQHCSHLTRALMLMGVGGVAGRKAGGATHHGSGICKEHPSNAVQQQLRQ